MEEKSPGKVLEKINNSTTSRSDIAIINDFARIKKIIPERTVFAKYIINDNIHKYYEVMNFYSKAKMIIYDKAFINCTFYDIDFNNIIFSDCYFTNCKFDHCIFNCTMATCIVDKRCEFIKCETIDFNLTVRLRNNEISPIEYKNSYIKLANKRKYFCSMIDYKYFNRHRDRIKGYKILIYNINYNMRYTINDEYINNLKKLKAAGIDNIYVYCDVSLDKGYKICPTIYGSLVKTNQIKIDKIRVPSSIYSSILNSSEFTNLSKMIHNGRITLPANENFNRIEQFVSEKYNNTNILCSCSLNSNSLDRFGGITFYTDIKDMMSEFNKNIITLG